MSRAMACRIVKVFSQKKEMTPQQLMDETGSCQANISYWLNAMQEEGLVRPKARAEEPAPGKRRNQLAIVWEWLC